jgi:hypothetical protein
LPPAYLGTWTEEIDDIFFTNKNLAKTWNVSGVNKRCESTTSRNEFESEIVANEND